MSHCRGHEERSNWLLAALVLPATMSLAGCGAGIPVDPAPGRPGTAQDQALNPGLYSGQSHCVIVTTDTASGLDATDEDDSFSSLTVGPSGLPVEDGAEVYVGQRESFSSGGIAVRTTTDNIVASTGGLELEYTAILTLNDGEFEFQLEGYGRDVYQQTGSSTIEIHTSLFTSYADELGFVSYGFECDGTLRR